jgi:hypothetical protein
MWKIITKLNNLSIDSNSPQMISLNKLIKTIPKLGTAPFILYQHQINPVGYNRFTQAVVQSKVEVNFRTSNI